jgi:hypothetical protein
MELLCPAAFKWVDRLVGGLPKIIFERLVAFPVALYAVLLVFDAVATVKTLVYIGQADPGGDPQEKRQEEGSSGTCGIH